MVLKAVICGEDRAGRSNRMVREVRLRSPHVFAGFDADRCHVIFSATCQTHLEMSTAEQSAASRCGALDSSSARNQVRDPKHGNHRGDDDARRGLHRHAFELRHVRVWNRFQS
jgi:hypothetical protein